VTQQHPLRLEERKLEGVPLVKGSRLVVSNLLVLKEVEEVAEVR